MSSTSCQVKEKMRWLYGIPDSMDTSLGKLREILEDRQPGVLQFVGSQRVRHDLVTEQQFLAPSHI